MKSKIEIISIKRIEVYIVETEGNEYWNTFRTDLNGENWEILMGNSWEDYYHDDEMKELFKQYIKNNVS